MDARVRLATAPKRYAAGAEIEGLELRQFSEVPTLAPPLVCMLCEAGFLSERALQKHFDESHGGRAEYRKRVQHLLEQRGPHPVSAQEKRIMIQNFAHFQQYSRLSSRGNDFHGAAPVPRAEAACVICARLRWLEQCFKLCLFGDGLQALWLNAPTRRRGDA